MKLIIKHLVFAMLFVTSLAFSETQKIRVIDMQVEPIMGIYTITGTAKNITNGTIKTAFIKFNLYDENKNLVGNTIAQVSNIEPGSTWKFAAQSAVRFASYKVSEISTYDN